MLYAIFEEREYAVVSEMTDFVLQGDGVDDVPVFGLW